MNGVRNFPLPGSPEANQSGPAEIILADLHRIAILTATEALQDRWTEAPVVCMNNNDRCQINLHRACVAAKKLGCPVTAWLPSITLKYENSKSTAATPLNSEEMQAMMNTDTHLLIQIFFPGQKVIVKRNINTSRKITNGAIGYDYCLDMPDSFTAGQKDAFQQEYNSTLPGNICWLPIPPEYRKVTMFVENINDKTWPESSILNGRGVVSDSIVSGQIIVPIPATKVLNGINLTRPPRPGLSKNVIVSQHLVQPAQAYTDFNIQGSTSKAIILYMNKGSKPSPSFETLYVAMTRGSGTDCIRFLPAPLGTDHSFLVGLKPSVNLKIWRNSYDTDGMFKRVLAKKAAIAFKVISSDFE